ncbi:RNA recognition motif domain-containing protein [Bacteroidota bacterium]
MNIYIGNLAKGVTENILQEAFEAYGQVASTSVIKDKYSGESKGFGFVEMPKKEEALAAVEALNDSELEGQKITVNEARPKREFKRGGGNRGGGGFRGGYGGGGRSGGGKTGGGKPGGGRFGGGGHRG